MNTLYYKKVTTRKAHYCFACSRKFEAGTKMQLQVVASDEISNIYTCETCEQLLTKHRYNFDDGCGVFWQNCVDDALDRNQTPEELLIKLDNTVII